MATGKVHVTSFKKVEYTAEYTVAATTGVNISADDFGMSTPSGYSVVAILKMGTGNSNTVPRYIDGSATGTSTAMGIRNLSSSSVTATARMTVLYLRA